MTPELKKKKKQTLEGRKRTCGIENYNREEKECKQSPSRQNQSKEARRSHLPTNFFPYRLQRREKGNEGQTLHRQGAHEAWDLETKEAEKQLKQGFQK